MRSRSLFLLAGLPVLASSPAVPFKIPAGPLPEALAAFSRQAGKAVLADRALLQGHRSPGLRASCAPQEALERLLAGTGLVSRPEGKGFRILRPELVLAPVVVKGEAENRTGRTELDRKTLDERPLGNRGLAELLTLQPGVRADNGAVSSTNRGSLDQPEISFHGASPTQNLFLLDGAGATSRFNPASKNANIQVGNVPSNSQAYFVDPALLGSLVIYDHNVPVEFGGFQGGVVDARLARASGHNSQSLGYEHSRSNWVKTRVNDLYESFYEDGRPGYTPVWRKNAVGYTIDRMLSDRWGIVGNLSRRMSSIRRMSTDGPTFSKDQVDNLFAKLSHWSGENTIHDFTLKASRRSDAYVSDFFRDSRWTNHHDASGFAYDLTHSGALGTLEFKAGYDTFSSRRWSNKADFVVHVVGTSQYSEVGFGTEETRQDTWSTRLVFRAHPVATGAFTHKATAGLAASAADAAFERHNDANSYNEYRATPTSTPILRNHWLYEKGEADTRYQEQGLFAEDVISFSHLTFTAGFRVDHDDFLENVNVAPRGILAWRLGGNADRVLSLGGARYYGTGQLAMATREALSRLKRRLTDSKGNPVQVTTLPAPSLYEGLRTPYTDEASLGYLHRLPGALFEVSAVHREGRDQVYASSLSATPTTAAGTRYLNGGRSTTDSLGATWKSLRAWSMFGASWSTRGELSWMRARRNHELLGSYDADIMHEKVYHNGHLIDASALPPADFNQPWKAQALLNGAWSGSGLFLVNDLRWTGPCKKPFYQGRNPQDGYEVYEDAPVGSFLTWNVTLAWRPTFHRALELRLVVENLLDRVPRLDISQPGLAYNTDTYGSGRGFQVAAKYTF